MNTRSKRASLVLWLCSLTAALVCALAAPAGADVTQDPPEDVMKKMLEATKAKSYDSFVAEADDAFRASLTKQMFDGASGVLGPRLAKGYKTSYLGKLHQQGHTVHLWKLELADRKDDDALIKMSVRAGKVSGYLVQ